MPYSMRDLNLDEQSAEWVNERVYVDGTTDDGTEITAVFEPVNMDPAADDTFEVHTDGITFAAFGRFVELHDVDTESGPKMLDIEP